MAAPPAQLADALANRYTIERELGRGGMATIFLARDLRHKRHVALKVLDPELAAGLGPERFRREIEMAAELQHPNVLPVFDSGEAGTSEGGGGWLWYTMPYVQGESLRDRIDRQGRLPIPEALKLAREVADALDYAHGRGVVHRDVKPGNILLSQGHALVADLGIARHAGRVPAGITESAAPTDALGTESALDVTLPGATLTSTGISLGTPAYMSPEQALGARDVDGRTDQYALACVLYEMLAGTPPYSGSTPRAVIGQHVTAPPPDVRAVRPEVPAGVAAAVARAMAKTPVARFATMAELAAGLETAEVVPAAQAPVRQLWRRGRLIGALAVAAIGVGAVLRWSGSATTLDEHLVAVAPFDVVGPELAPWRERMADHVARNLDGAGSLRTVPPTTVLGRWQGRADPAAATAFGRRNGAGLVVYGQLLGVGRDSVRIVATLVNARRGTVLTEARAAEAAERIDRAADAVTLELLRLAGGSQRVGRAAQGRLGSRSPAAIRAFLGGEQFYRRGRWDSAIARYKEAVEADSNFTLAYWHLGRVVRLHRGEDWSPFSLKAGASTRGLSPRDSLLITADSLAAAIETSPVPLGLEPKTRLILMLEDDAVRQYPEDPEAWYMLGDARVHSDVGVAPAYALHAFERAIALDSLFMPAYVHAIELKLMVGDPAGALRYFERMRALGADMPPETTERGQRYLLRAAVAGAPIEEDSVTLEDLRSSPVLSRWPDSGMTTISMARALLRKSRAAWEATARDWDDPTTFVVGKEIAGGAQMLGYRGHLAEAAEAVGDGLPSFRDELPILLEISLLGAVPEERVQRALRAAGTLTKEWTVPWWSSWWGARRDTVVLRRIAARGRGRVASGLSEDAVLTASAFLALARHDTTKALEELAILTDSLFRGSTVALERARLLVATGELDAARRVYRRVSGDGPLTVLARLELAEVAERQSARDLALESYRFVAAVWRHADPLVQPFVARARAGIERLTRERVEG